MLIDKYQKCACGCFNANNVFLEGRKLKYDKYNNKKLTEKSQTPISIFY
jgi:hypothetical protein